MSRDRKIGFSLRDDLYYIKSTIQWTRTFIILLLRHFISYFLSWSSSVETVITVNKPSCAGLPQECTEQPETDSREVKCTCPTVECKWNAWSTWSATCGAASRTRTIKTIKVWIELSGLKRENNPREGTYLTSCKLFRAIFRFMVRYTNPDWRIAKAILKGSKWVVCLTERQ